MLLNYNKISPKSLFFKEIERLYCHSFPVDERRKLSDFEEISASSTQFAVMGIFNGDKLIGFINYWDFHSFLYIEHFAIDPECRNGGIGGRSLRNFLTGKQLPVIIEVEPPCDELTRRRIAFYERMGFKLWNEIDYVQPPYDSDRNSLNLMLMTWQFEDVLQVNDAAETVKKNVYENSCWVK